MANKLSWDPPKWKSYSFDGERFEVELENGKVYTGKLGDAFIDMGREHQTRCYEIFGQCFTSGRINKLQELSKVLDLELKLGYWPEYHDVREFLKRYYEKIAKIEESFTKSIISIESEFDITPKFTI